MSKDIYKMKLHETTRIIKPNVDDSGESITIFITRVPGGWIYNTDKAGLMNVSSVFVPFRNGCKRIDEDA